MLLEKIQAEAAAYYSYEELPKEQPNEHRKFARTNLLTKYDSVSLDELAGKKNPENNSLDFKVLSLDEIRARKNKTESIINTKPITVTLNRKRKLSSHETIVDSSNKIVKVVRNNSVVYKKVDPENPNTSKQQTEQKVIDCADSTDGRVRTMSEQTECLEIQDDELEDCLKFKRVKMLDQTVKPVLIRNKSSTSESKAETEPKEPVADVSCKFDDSDSEVQIIDEDVDIIDLDDAKITDDVVELSEDSMSDVDLEFIHNVPDVVASCQTNGGKQSSEKDDADDISSLMHDDL